MTLDISQLRERVGVRFPDLEQVDDAIIRFTRRAGNLPFAVYYLDLTQDLPDSQEKLTKYQDRVIGRHYFEGEKSLQWSNYLYFITSAERLLANDARQAKELIERDRSYARKFVIPEEELDSILAPSIVAPSDPTPRTNILSVWTDRLVEAGLDKAILSDDDLPARLKLIEASSKAAPSRAKVAKPSMEVKAAPFIRSLQLKNYRAFPLQRRFDFGKANLICGANGTGKTSLLEAIELFYCGRNKRNPDAESDYELITHLGDGEIETVRGSRSLQKLRDRNLAWYGQPEVKTNNLYLSFARFNFLDTDAAVSLAESTSRMEEDLSRLLIGPDASKTWRDIERVHEAISSRLRELQSIELRDKEDLAEIERHLRIAGEIRQQSDSIRARLEEMLHSVGWTISESDKETFPAKLLESLSELISLTQQSLRLGWTQSPVSLDGLAKFIHGAKATIKKAEKDLAHLELLRKSQMLHTGAIKRGREALDLAEQAKHLIEADVSNRAKECSKQQSVVAQYSSWLAGLDADALDVLSPEFLDMTVAVFKETSVSRRSTAETLLLHAKSEYSNFSKVRDQSLRQSQELRQIAARIIRSSNRTDECPLCHTQFQPGELEHHINVGVDERLEVLGQRLLVQLQECEGRISEANTNETVSVWLNKFCERAKLPSKILVHLAVVKVNEARQRLGEDLARLQALKSELAALESQGLSATRLEEILSRLRELEYPLMESSREASDLLLSAIQRSLATSTLSLETETILAGQLQSALEITLSAESGVDSFMGALSRVKERLATTESLHAKLIRFSSSFHWSGDRALAELAVEANSIRTVSAELQAALGTERQMKATHTESIKRKERLILQLAELRPRIKRLLEAKSVLENLQNTNSLKMAMESSLQQNRAGIEAIFSRIHSPAEFRGIGSSWVKLVRKVDSSEAKLSEISTGQRAAFALSIFLAQNAELRLAPPVLLIDDPIAHIDDLNSLSFLDYLRELVLTGRRQVFFATANDKLATLFERKFDFLGVEGFRRIDLKRETRILSSLQ